MHFKSKRLPACSRGFTLIEILVVVLMVAILAAIALPRLVNQSDKAVAAEALTMAGSIKRAELRYFDENGQWLPSDDVCGTAADSAALLISCGGNEKWTYEVDAADVTDAASVVSITAVNKAVNADKLILHVSGANKNKWDGAGKYDPDSGTNWPNIPAADTV